MNQQALRFGLVGIVNTVVGYGVVLAGLAAGFGDYASNAQGYAAGLLLGFVLNGHWAFASATSPHRPLERREMILYIAASAISYSLNLATLTILRVGHVVPSSVAQLVAMAAYSTSFSILWRQMVFMDDNSHLERLFSSPEILLSAVITLGAPIAIMLPVSHDVVWQMWIARQMDHGAKLYSDILELNPPLWFWMGLAVQKLGTALGCAPLALLKLGIWLWAALSAYAVGMLTPELNARRQTALILFAFAVCALLPLHTYGQREHLVLIAGLPYAFLLAARARNKTPNQGLVLGVTVAAAAAFALKHYFVLVPLMGEIWLLFRLRKSYRPVRMETLVLATLATLYGVAVVIWARPYLTSIVPTIRLAYGGYEVSFIEQVNQPEQVIWLIAAFCFARFGRPYDPALRNLAEILLVCTVAFLISYFAQQKGWQYHALPATGMAVMAVFVATLLPVPVNRPTGRTALPVFTCLLPLLLAASQGPYVNANKQNFASITRGMAPGSSFLTIATNPSWTWPMVEDEGYIWPSRYFAFWMMASVGLNEVSDHRQPALDRLGEKVVRDTVEDMRCNPPQRILVQVIPTQRGLRVIGFRMFEFFSRNPEFAKIMNHYRTIESVPSYELYELARPYGPKSGDHCRVIRR